MKYPVWKFWTETRDKIDLASKIPGFLNYELGTPDKGEAVITVTYHKKDGSTVEISANESTVYWHGRAYKIKWEKGRTFINVTRGIFFPDILVEMRTAMKTQS